MCLPVCMFVCTVCVFVYPCASVCMYSVFVFMYLYVSACLYVCMYSVCVFVYPYVSVCLYVQCVHVHTCMVYSV